MKITPLDIRQKTFERAFRGVDKDEVDAFLLTLSQQWERMTDENREVYEYFLRSGDAKGNTGRLKFGIDQS